jgi:hypothetical protein
MMLQRRNLGDEFAETLKEKMGYIYIHVYIYICIYTVHIYYIYIIVHPVSNKISGYHGIFYMHRIS